MKLQKRKHNKRKVVNCWLIDFNCCAGFCFLPSAEHHQRDAPVATWHLQQDAVLDIFDDRDFYVQLLKEVLSGGAGVLSQQDEEKQLLAEIQGREVVGLKTGSF